MDKIVFLRHGESTWNLENRFTGWTDVDLSTNGLKEANDAGQTLKERGFEFDCTFTSYLKRAIRTLWIVQDVMDLMWLPVFKDWRLNERHYGALQGLNKAEVAAEHGAEQLLQWRRGYAVQPPPLTDDDPRHPRFEAKYRHVDPQLLPPTESLADTVERAVAVWQESLVGRLREGERILVVAHGNTLRGIMKYLDDISDEDIMAVNIPTGIPLVYEFDDQQRPVRHYYLADQERVDAAAKAVAQQASKRSA